MYLLGRGGLVGVLLLHKGLQLLGRGALIEGLLGRGGLVGALLLHKGLLGSTSAVAVAVLY
jgi:hypothetical protein